MNKLELLDQKIKLCVVMVGLPARGKSFIAKQLERYFKWIGFACKIFNVGDYRRRHCDVGECHASFFNFNDPETLSKREQLASMAKLDAIAWLENCLRPSVAIFDATNVTVSRRKTIYGAFTEHYIKVLFIESICNDQQLVNATIENVKVLSPEYSYLEREEAKEDFISRIKEYEAVYVPINANESNYSYIKILNTGQQFELNCCSEYIHSLVVRFLMSLRIGPKVIYLSRHGESEFNPEGRIGGDPPLTEKGLKYADNLVRFFENENVEGLILFTSSLKRAMQTGEPLPLEKTSFSLLNEINAGICESLTYSEIAGKYPSIPQQRVADKFGFRYPNGESYKDVYARIEPLLIELQRMDSVVVISHYAVLRCILAYFLGVPTQDAPFIYLPLHHVFKLTRTFDQFDLAVLKIGDPDESLSTLTGTNLTYLERK